MALIKCSECQNDVSDKAIACPKCGAPIAASARVLPGIKEQGVEHKEHKEQNGHPLLGIAVVIGIMAIVIYAFSGSGNNAKSNASDTTQTASEEKPGCASNDLSCWGNKGVVAAGVYCPRYIEQLAKHSVKWTDGTFELKFSRFRWADQEKGIITYIGDKAEFQNGFGAYTNVIYQCDMAADGKTVLDARVVEGRLPPN